MNIETGPFEQSHLHKRDYDFPKSFPGAAISRLFDSSFTFDTSIAEQHTTAMATTDFTKSCHAIERQTESGSHSSWMYTHGLDIDVRSWPSRMNFPATMNTQRPRVVSSAIPQDSELVQVFQRCQSASLAIHCRKTTSTLVSKWKGSHPSLEHYQSYIVL